VLGRPALHDVGDVDLPPLELDRRDHLVEQLAGAADEGPPARVLVRARPLPDEEDRRVERALARYRPVALLAELAGGAARDLLRHAVELRLALLSSGGHGGRRREERAGAGRDRWRRRRRCAG